jgi:hypothetical protein
LVDARQPRLRAPVELRMLQDVKLVLVLVAFAAFVACAACAAAPRPVPRPAEGSIVGLARDRDSGDAVAKVAVNIRAQGQIAAQRTLTEANGRYRQPHLAPGMYSVSADFAGQQVTVKNIALAAGEPTVVDLEFDLGKPDPVMVDFGNSAASEIEHFTPKDHQPRIEGTVNVRSSHTRVEGAVVTVVGLGQTLQAVTDDQGRFAFAVSPGTYAVSAYYAVDSIGEIEVKRSAIEVAANEGVVVPLWIETTSK